MANTNGFKKYVNRNDSNFFFFYYHLIIAFYFDLKLQSNTQEVKCRYDWHQTASNVVIALYAKTYHYEKSFVKLNPVRLVVSLVFPEQDNAEFNLDLELRGVSKRILNQQEHVF